METWPSWGNISFLLSGQEIFKRSINDAISILQWTKTCINRFLVGLYLSIIQRHKKKQQRKKKKQEKTKPNKKPPKNPQKTKSKTRQNRVKLDAFLMRMNFSDEVFFLLFSYIVFIMFFKNSYAFLATCAPKQYFSTLIIYMFSHFFSLCVLSDIIYFNK